MHYVIGRKHSLGKEFSHRLMVMHLFVFGKYWGTIQVSMRSQRPAARAYNNDPRSAVGELNC